MLVTLSVLAGLLAFEYTYSLLLLSQPKEVSVDIHQSSGTQRTSIVLPGFSNPSRYFGVGMRRILSRYGPMLVLHHSTTVDFDKIYEAIMAKLAALNGPRQILVYGHSMGGQIGEQFRQRYEREGSPHGPICELILDCSPGSARSLPAPKWLTSTLRVLFRFYWGGPIMALVAALGSVYSRVAMRVRPSSEVDPALYRHYIHGMTWFNNRAWIAQMKWMLHYRPPTQPINTSTRIFYIGAEDPTRDGLVRQVVAILEWRRAHPTMQVMLHKNVGHAWPMEQPEAYAEMVSEILSVKAA